MGGVIVKYGSSSVTSETGIDQERLDGYAEQLQMVSERDSLVVVTSGAVVEGSRRYTQHAQDIEEGEKVVDKRALAMLGSAGIAKAWESAFRNIGVLAGQVLLTHREIDDKEEGGSLVSSIEGVQKYGMVPVVNENDLLSDFELRKLSYGGENDGLAAHLAIRLGAKSLLLLTNRDGFMVGGRVQKEFNVSDKELLAHAGESYSDGQDGTGGMITKLNASILAVEGGVEQVHIGNAGADLMRILDGQIGTQVLQ